MRRYHYSEVTPETARRIRFRRAGSWHELDRWLDEQAGRRRQRDRKAINRWRQRYQGEFRRIAAESPMIHAEIAYGLRVGMPPGRCDPVRYAIMVRMGRKAAEMIGKIDLGLLTELGQRLMQGAADGLVADLTWAQTPDGPRLVEVSLVARKDIPS